MSNQRNIPARRVRTTRIQALADLVEQVLAGVGMTLENLYTMLGKAYGQHELSLALDSLEARGRIVFMAANTRLSVCLAPPADDLDESRDQLKDAAADLHDWAKQLKAPAAAIGQANNRDLTAMQFVHRLIEAAELAEDLVRPPESQP